MKKLQDRPKIEYILEENFPKVGKIRLHSASYEKIKDENIFNLEFLTEDAIENESEICKFLAEQFKTTTNVKFTKSHFDEDFLERKIVNFFVANNNYLSNKITRERYMLDCVDDVIVITFLGDVNFCSTIENRVAPQLEKFLYRSFIDDFEVKTYVDREFEELASATQNFESRAVEVSNLEAFIGKPELEKPGFICDIEKEYDRAIVCGVISKIEEKVKKEQIQRGKKKLNDKYFKFELKDVTGSLTCLIFPSFSNHEKVKKLEGVQVVLGGRIKVGIMGEFALMVSTVTKCKILSTEPPKNKLIKDEPTQYSAVFPEAVEVYEQVNMLEKKKEDDLSKLLGKTIVVFDLETTGLSPNKDKIVEIGAVKLVDGKFTEKFSTLVNPEVLMSDANVKIHGIKNDDVKFSPVIDDVIIDFYKFSFGAILCGHNCNGFDIPFIRANALKFGFDFFNPRIDTLDLAVRFVKGTPNNKLGSLCTHFGIVNEQAHRAYEDAIATGQVLIKILSEIPQANI